LFFAFCFAMLMSTAHADELQDASRLLKQGQSKQALEQVDIYLNSHPKDASGRFLRGVIMTEMNRSTEAITIFTKLTEDYPDLPEPYNNLAVIYAQQKQYDKAKAALEAAIRTHPSYATAHENLGDIYARMASQAYDKALQLDSSNKTAQTKLSMIRDLMVVSARSNPPSTVVASKPITVEPKPIVPATPPIVIAANTPVVSKAPVTTPVGPTPPPVAAPASVVASMPKPAPPPAPAMVADDEIARALNEWASAWSHKDAKAYLSFYASNFKTPGGVSRAAWAEERTKRVTKPGKINVAIEAARVSPESADRAVVRFRQHYKSASLSSSSNKVLLMERQGGQWKIAQERIGN
jgi:tetratricopeptide (TPR) repeat protein